MSSRHLHSELDRAKQRLTYCLRQRESYHAYADANDPTQQRTLRKLEEDEKRAQVDYNRVQHRLTERLHVEGLSD